MITQFQILMLGIICFIACITAFSIEDTLGGYLLAIAVLFCFSYFFYKTYIKRDMGEGDEDK